MKETAGTREYKHFIIKYILPLIGIRDNNLLDCEGPSDGRLVFQEEDFLFFSTKTEILFKILYKRNLTLDNSALIKCIIRAYFNVCKFKPTRVNKIHNMNYYSDYQQEINYQLAIQNGILEWLIGKKSTKIEKLFSILEKWAVQTYEGRKVSMGFIINPEAKSTMNDDEFGNWLDFLKDDISAVFTDCINSVVELDGDCNFVQYLSITTNDTIKECKLTDLLPYRFAPIVQQFVNGKCVGVFLLNNGDIILAKKQSIRFVRRNLKWLNLSYDAFETAINSSNLVISKKLIKSIYVSMLDVSFAHSGGIIAVTNRFDKLCESNNNLPVVSITDNLCDKTELADLKKNLIEQNEAYVHIKKQDLEKRLLKRKILNALVKKSKFTELDRKLKCELISLDGACIIDNEGKICSFGAIIMNDSGSSGGGRGAATRKLSRYGLAIKISTDGYIELYINGEQKYVIK